MMEMAVAKWLMAAGVKDVLVGTSSALEVPEPVVVCDASYSREVRTRGMERGFHEVTVLVCREVASLAGAYALRAETAIRRSDWKAEDAEAGWRLVGVDTTVPAFNGFDGSGRAVFSFKVTLHCERDE